MTKIILNLLLAAIKSVCIALLICELMVDLFLLGKISLNRFGTIRHLTCVVITYNIIPTSVIMANPKMRKNLVLKLQDIYIIAPHEFLKSVRDFFYRNVYKKSVHSVNIWNFAVSDG